MRSITTKRRGLVRSAMLAIFLPLVTAALCPAQKPLRIGPGDTLNVHVFDTPEMEQNPRVSTSGDIHLELIGDVHVGGLTPQEASVEVERILIERKLMKHPSVVVTVTGYEGENVSVTGEVNHPAAFLITSSRSMIDVIALAGGLTPLADRRNIVIHRKGSDVDETYFFSNDPHEAIHNDVRVEPGDTVVVPRVGIVYVLGDVGRAGGFPIDTPDSRMTVLKAVALAGATNHSAWPSKARLIRKTPDGFQDIHLQVSDIQKGKAPDVQMVANDVLYIPFSYIKNAFALGTASIVSTAATAAIYTH